MLGQPKVHMGAQQAMQQGVGGLHRPMSKTPTVGASVLGAFQARAAAPTGAGPAPRVTTQQGAAGSVSPQMAAFLQQLPRPQVRVPLPVVTGTAGLPQRPQLVRPAPTAMSPQGAAILSLLMQLRGGR